MDRTGVPAAASAVPAPTKVKMATKATSTKIQSLLRII